MGVGEAGVTGADVVFPAKAENSKEAENVMNQNHSMEVIFFIQILTF